MDKGITAFVAILTAIVGVAIVAVLVSSKSQTAQVLQAGGNTFAGILGAAVAPVSGGLSSSLGASLPSFVP